MVKIEKIQIKNYRGIREGVIDNLADVNILVGRNGGGKSTILESLYMIGHAIEPQPGLIGGRNKILHLLHKRNMSPQANVEGVIQWPEGSTAISHVPILSDDCWFGNDTKNDIHISCSMAGGSIGGVDVKITKNTGQSAVSLLPPLAGPSVNSRQFLSNMLFIDSSLQSKDNVEKLLWTVVIQKNREGELIKDFNSIFPYKIAAIRYTPLGFYVMPEGADYGIRIDNLGAGMRIVLRLLFMFMHVSGTVVLMEEFDAYESHESLAHIARVILNASYRQGIQFFMTTHRMECIRGFLDNHEKFKNVRGSVLFTTLESDGSLGIKSLEFPYALKLIKSGVDIRELEDYE